jgi:hypothetical protein
MVKVSPWKGNRVEVSLLVFLHRWKDCSWKSIDPLQTLAFSVVAVRRA